MIETTTRLSRAGRSRRGGRGWSYLGIALAGFLVAVMLAMQAKAAEAWQPPTPHGLESRG